MPAPKGFKFKAKANVKTSKGDDTRSDDAEKKGLKRTRESSSASPSPKRGKDGAQAQSKRYQIHSPHIATDPVYFGGHSMFPWCRPLDLFCPITTSNLILLLSPPFQPVSRSSRHDPRVILCTVRCITLNSNPNSALADTARPRLSSGKLPPPLPPLLQQC